MLWSTVMSRPCGSVIWYWPSAVSPLILIPGPPSKLEFDDLVDVPTPRAPRRAAPAAAPATGPPRLLTARPPATETMAIAAALPAARLAELFAAVASRFATPEEDRE